MFAPLVSIARWLWSAVLSPYIVLTLVALVADSVEAWCGLPETLRVMCLFLRGRSHRSFPVPRASLAACKSAALAETRAHMERRRGGGGGGAHHDSSSSDGENITDTDVNRGGCGSSSAPDMPAAAVGGAVIPKDSKRAAAAAGESASLLSKLLGKMAASAAVHVQRRILLGKKGEREVWLDGVQGRLLVPASFPLSYSQSLHLLIGCVIGPLQQPTVSTMPNRHPAPQWPPHYVRSAGGASARVTVTGASTGDYSSSSSHTLSRRRAALGIDSNSSATEAGSAQLVGARRGPAGYRQAANVVYRRASARQMDFWPTRKAAGPNAQVIASITANHVLSYQATRQKVLVMDLDETLCYVSTSTANMLGPPTFSEVVPTASGAELFHVWERPHARLFLETMAKLFNLVLFTSASKSYADTVLLRIDPGFLLKERYYRQDCRVVSRGALARSLRDKRQAAVSEWGGPVGAALARSKLTHAAASAAGGTDVERVAGGHAEATGVSGAASDERPEGEQGGGTTAVTSGGGQLPGVERPPLNDSAKVLMKDLRLLKVPMELVVMIDNSEECTLLNRENALIIEPYIPSVEMQKKAAKSAEGEGIGCGGPEEDEVLLGLMSFLEPLLVVPDVRSILRHGKIY